MSIIERIRELSARHNAYTTRGGTQGLQYGISSGPGAMYVPSGTYYFDEIDELVQEAGLQLPRTTLNAVNGVSLLGEGQNRTYLKARSPTTWADGRPPLGWAPSNGAVSGRRNWVGEISGFTIEAPKAACNLIEYKITDVAQEQAVPSWEKIGDIILRDICFETWNDYPQTCVYIEGVAHSIRCDNLVADPGSSGSIAYDTLLMQFEMGEDIVPGLDDGNDVANALACWITNCKTTPRRGGRARILAGRLLHCVLQNLNGGRGAIGGPQIHLRNSINVIIDNLNTEGNAEQPGQIHLKGCRGIDIRGLLLGTPNADVIANPSATYPIGTGVFMENSHDCDIHWTANADKPPWDTLPTGTPPNPDPSPGGGAWRVVMDAECTNNRLQLVATTGVGGNESMANMVKDLGVNNEVIVRYTDGTQERMLNGVAYAPAVRATPSVAVDVEDYFTTVENLWPMNETSGTAINDVVGTTHLTAVNSPKVGKRGQIQLVGDRCVHYDGGDGTSEILRFASNAIFQLGTAGTLVLQWDWIQTEENVVQRYVASKIGSPQFWGVRRRPGDPYGDIDYVFNDGTNPAVDEYIEFDGVDRGVNHPIGRVNTCRLVVTATQVGLCSQLGMALVSARPPLTLDNTGILGFGRNASTTCGMKILRAVATTDVTGEIVSNTMSGAYARLLAYRKAYHF